MYKKNAPEARDTYVSQAPFLTCFPHTLLASLLPLSLLSLIAVVVVVACGS